MTRLKRERDFGTFKVQKSGNSHVVTLSRNLDGEQFPNFQGDELREILVDDGDEQYIKLVPSE
ncbi:hypothetical protein [Halomarina rubra]|uniref:Uncharacterized protein n=1 Tax=Halomarina rubra TaxID=2071873 RepID=A0ABD6B1H7_9EURY|nr:hypothetical protein [Halomarina rubra]